MEIKPELTNAEKRCLAVLRELLKASRIPPTVQELGDAMSVSRQTAFTHISGLIEKGIVRRTDKYRSLEIVPRRRLARAKSRRRAA